MTDATAQFRTILDWLCRAIAARAGRDHALVPLVGPFIQGCGEF